MQLPLEPQEALNVHICSSTSKVWNWWSYPLLKRGRGTMTFSKQITTHLKHPHRVLYIKCHYKYFISMQKNTKTKQNTVTISLRAERLSWQKIKHWMQLWDASHDVIGNLSKWVTSSLMFDSGSLRYDIKGLRTGLESKSIIQSKTCTIGKTCDLYKIIPFQTTVNKA